MPGLIERYTKWLHPQWTARIVEIPAAPERTGVGT